jgi:hypothetical protein
MVGPTPKTTSNQRISFDLIPCLRRKIAPCAALFAEFEGPARTSVAASPRRKAASGPVGAVLAQDVLSNFRPPEHIAMNFNGLAHIGDPIPTATRQVSPGNDASCVARFAELQGAYACR